MSKGNAGAMFRIPRLISLKKHLGFNDCVIPGCTNRVTIHHIVPKAKGGKSNVENLMPICHKHHSLLHNGCASRGPKVVEYQKKCSVDGCDGDGFNKKHGKWTCRFHNWERVVERAKAKYGADFVPRPYEP